jgi:hypothetical protein
MQCLHFVTCSKLTGAIHGHWVCKSVYSMVQWFWPNGINSTASEEWAHCMASQIQKASAGNRIRGWISNWNAYGWLTYCYHGYSSLFTSDKVNLLESGRKKGSSPNRGSVLTLGASIRHFGDIFWSQYPMPWLKSCSAFCRMGLSWALRSKHLPLLPEESKRVSLLNDVQFIHPKNILRKHADYDIRGS